MTSALDITDLHATYPTRRRQPGGKALDGVSLSVPDGGSVALLGPNGSGKSTLMRIVCGLQAPDKPTGAGAVIRVLGSPDPAHFRRELGVVFQSPALDPHLTVAENLIDQARLFGLGGSAGRSRVEEGLAAVGLSDRADALVRTLSGGMKRRADLCRALLHAPKLLLLDEPTSGLDPVSRQQFLDHLDERRRADGIAVLMSTHLVDEAERLDRAVLLAEGRIVADGTCTELRARLGTHRITVLDPEWEPPDSSVWTTARGLWSRPVDGDAPPIAESLARSGVPFTLASPDLGDVFAVLTGSSLDPALPADAA